MVLRLLIAAVGIALLAPGSAAALPGDAPIQLLSPADGATVAANPAGIDVTYRCPAYRSSSLGDGFSVFLGRESYGVIFSASPAVGPDGRLADALVRSTASAPDPTDTELCASTFTDGSTSGPHASNGVYHWQVWRICVGCETGYETSPVSRFTVSAPAVPRVRPPARAWSGYAATVDLRLDGAPDGSAFVLERQAGTRWVPVGSGQALEERGFVDKAFPRGRVRLRARVTVGQRAFVSPVVSLRVADGSRARRQTGRADDGAWRGRAGGRTLTFRVVRGGREIRALEGVVQATCPASVPGQFTVAPKAVRFARVPVAPDGSFVATVRRGAAATRIAGTLRGGRVRGGDVRYRDASCVAGAARITARRG